MAYGGIDALKQSGLRYVYGFYPRNEKEFGKNARKIKEIVDKDPLGSFMISSHPNKLLRISADKAVKLSEELKVPLNFHYGESVLDKQHEQQKVILEVNAYKRPVILNHVVHVTDDEIKLMAVSQARITYNPLSNMRLASGIMPVGKLHSAGLLIGLGLDGAANDNANFFSLMKAAVGLQRAKNESPDVYPDYKDVMLMATIEGARVLNLDKITGSVEKNKSADLIIINPHSTNMGVNFDTIAQIPLNSEPTNVETVMVNGRILKKDGKIVYSNESLNQLIKINKKTVERFMHRSATRLVDIPD